MGLEGRRFRRRKKEDVFVEGFFIDHATVVTPGIDRSDETHHLYGKDSPETDVQHNVAQLTLDVLDKFQNNAILDLITGQNPDLTGTAGQDGVRPVKQYNVQDLTPVTVWANVKDQKSQNYVKSWAITGWTPGYPMPSGGANDKTMWNLQGNGDLPRHFDNAWIKGKKIASGSNLGLTPVVVPGETNYAVAVKAMYSGTGVFQQQDVAVTAAMISSTGVITWSEIVTQATELSQVTHAYFLVLQTGSGVYPTVTQDKMRQ